MDLTLDSAAVFQDSEGQFHIFAYVTARGHTLLDRALYLPVDWMEDRQRCREAGIPERVRFQTKCELAVQMLERLWKVDIPISWVVADTDYGGNLDLCTWLEAHQYSYVVAVAYDEPVGIQTPNGRRRVQVAKVDQSLLHDEDWHRLSMSEGTKGPRLFDWACFPMLHRWEDDGHHWLLIRRILTDPQGKRYYFVFAPQGTTLQEIEQAIGARWHIENRLHWGRDATLGEDDCGVRLPKVGSDARRTQHRSTLIDGSASGFQRRSPNPARRLSP